MKKIMMALAAALISAPALADPIKDKSTSPCILWDVCYSENALIMLKNLKQFLTSTKMTTWLMLITILLLMSLTLSSDHLMQSEAKVFLADERYFPVGHRGVYHTVSNNFFLNVAHMKRPHTLMSVMRHEGWHAAQDCMAGSIKNNFIAIIKNEEDVPRMYQAIAKSAYATQPHAIPWEKEAYWAGHTEGMTQAALESCARGTMWTDYEPTPMTREWLVENGYITK